MASFHGAGHPLPAPARNGARDARSAPWSGVFFLTLDQIGELGHAPERQIDSPAARYPGRTAINHTVDPVKCQSRGTAEDNHVPRAQLDALRGAPPRRAP